ncbi:hypothetical protein NKDENANG_03442 [Candidatus Entotheonellaceae bacterium PAL068K]
MLMFNRILLASDFSASADAALYYAAALARHSDAQLIVLHVIDTRVVAFPRWHDIFDSTAVLAAREANETEAFERLLTHPAVAGLTVERLLQHGNPTDHIIDLAPRVDLVVMGLPAMGSGRRSTAGTVSRRVTHSCPTPVLLIPKGGGQAGVPAAGTTQVSTQHVLLALHFARYAPQATALAQAFAATCNATLQVLQVLEPDKVTSYPLDAGTGLYHNLDAAKVVLRKRLAEIVPAAPVGPAVEHVVVQGNAAEVIVQQSRAHRTDLVVMSAHAYGTLRRLFTVSTVDAVLERVPCPLLAVPLLGPTVPSTSRGNGAVNVG